MVQKVVLLTESDLSGEPGAHRFRFSIAEIAYEVDLTGAELEDFLALVRPYVQVARVEESPRARTEAGRTPDVIRAWANAQGLAVPARGRISGELRDLFLKSAETPAPAER